MSRFLDMLVFGGERRNLPGPQPPGGRRLFHVIAGSSIPLAGIFVAETALIWVLALLALGSLVLDLVRFRIEELNLIFTRFLAPLLKQDEVAHITGATYMVIAAFFVFLIFGKDVAIPAMFFLSLGDPVAALVGKDMPGPRLLGKSPFGTAAFIVVGCTALALLLATDGIDHHRGLWLGATVAGLIELASIPPDDNLTIPVLAGAVMFGIGV